MTVIPSNLVLTRSDIEYTALSATNASDTLAAFPPQNVPWKKQNQPPASNPRSFQNTAIPTFYHCNVFRQMPLLEANCRTRVLHIIVEAGTRNRDRNAIPTDTPLLSLQALQSYSDSFFSGFNDSMAIVHRPTFQPSTSEPLLLLAILLIGAAYSDQAACNMALGIYDTLPTLILRECVSLMKPELWQMQTLLLLECFGRLRGNQQQHDIAHVYHSLLVQ